MQQFFNYLRILIFSEEKTKEDLLEEAREKRRLYNGKRMRVCCDTRVPVTSVTVTVSACVRAAIRVFR